MFAKGGDRHEETIRNKHVGLVEESDDVACSDGGLDRRADRADLRWSHTLAGHPEGPVRHRPGHEYAGNKCSWSIAVVYQGTTSSYVDMGDPIIHHYAV